ncbi:MAG: NlpC/P60 family protein [Propionicimonas sp.]|nr:NlpC/P60 family protein [Propionicimonas sp.]
MRSQLRGFLVAVAAGALTAGLCIPTADAAPTPKPSPTPTTIADAKAQVQKLETEASAVEEDYEEAKIQLGEGEQRLKGLQADIAKQQEKVDQLGSQARAVALIQFQGRGIDTTVQLFTESDPEAFLGRLATTSSVDANLNSTLQELQAQQANLLDLKRAAEAEVEALDAERARLADLDKTLKAKITESQALVSRLTEEERQRLAREEAGDSFDLGEIDDDPDSRSGNTKDRIKKVIAYAVSKVPSGQYVTGGAGPKNFDCSGLMLAAYRQIGVKLPHSSRAMSRIGKPVKRSELKPGDLIFWYSPVHHVGMYIGNGKIVHARNPRADLVVQKLSSYPAPWSGARRILG